MDPKYYKKVLMPITVSAGDYCWGPGKGGIKCICEHFSNEGGHPVCNLGLGNLKYDPKGLIIKPEHCLKLKETD